MVMLSGFGVAVGSILGEAVTTAVVDGVTVTVLFRAAKLGLLVLLLGSVATALLEEFVDLS